MSAPTHPKAALLMLAGAIPMQRSDALKWESRMAFLIQHEQGKYVLEHKIDESKNRDRSTAYAIDATTWGKIPTAIWQIRRLRAPAPNVLDKLSEWDWDQEKYVWIWDTMPQPVIDMFISGDMRITTKRW